MPLKLSIGLSRKVGEPGFGSRGATVGLEMEAEASLVDRPEEFHDQAAHLFSLARDAVDRELARSLASASNGVSRHGRATQHRRLPRVATPNQLRAIRAIAGEQALDLATELRDRFGIERPDDLSLVQASELIGALKSAAREKYLLEVGAEPPSSAEDGG